MTQRRIVPTLTLLAAVAAAGGLACRCPDSWYGKLDEVWRSITSPQLARAGDEGSATQASVGPGPRIVNPFAVTATDTAANEPAPAQSELSAQPRAASAPRRNPVPNATRPQAMRQAPSLEPIEMRRTNPPLVEEAADEPVAVRAMPESIRAARTVPAEIAEQHIEADYVMPAAHHKTVAPAAGLEPVTAEPAPLVASPIESTSESFAPIEQTVAAEPILEEPPAQERLVEPPLAEPASLPVAENALPVADACQHGEGVHLQWITPNTITLGQEVTCQLLVRNSTDSAALGVAVVAELPDNVDAGPVEPNAKIEGRRIAWRWENWLRALRTACR